MMIEQDKAHTVLITCLVHSRNFVFLKDLTDNKPRRAKMTPILRAKEITKREHSKKLSQMPNIFHLKELYFY